MKKGGKKKCCEKFNTAQQNGKAVESYVRKIFARYIRLQL